MNGCPFGIESQDINLVSVRCTESMHNVRSLDAMCTHDPPDVAQPALDDNGKIYVSSHSAEAAILKQKRRCPNNRKRDVVRLENARDRAQCSPLRVL